MGLLLCLPAIPLRGWAGSGDRPNILFILTDDLGYGDMGVFYQNQCAAQQDRSVPFFSAPNIDTLARDGAMLTQQYSGAPVCAPSRASLLSGLTQGNCNVRDNQFDKALADSYTLASVLRSAGYATAGWHPIRLYDRHAGGVKPYLALHCQWDGTGEYKWSPAMFRSPANRPWRDPLSVKASTGLEWGFRPGRPPGAGRPWRQWLKPAAGAAFILNVDPVAGIQIK